MLQGMGVGAVLVKLGADGSLLLPGACLGRGCSFGQPLEQCARGCCADAAARGCTAGLGQAPIRQQAFKASKVVDTTGACTRCLRHAACTAPPPAHSMCSLWGLTLLLGQAGAARTRAAAVPAAGAGDCFTAAYTVATLEGLDARAALRFASAAGCICVQRPGAMPSMPSRQEVDALLASAAQ